MKSLVLSFCLIAAAVCAPTTQYPGLVSRNVATGTVNPWWGGRRIEKVVSARVRVEFANQIANQPRDTGRYLATQASTVA